MLAFNQFVNPWALEELKWKYVSFLFSVLCFYIVGQLIVRGLDSTSSIVDGWPLSLALC